MRNLLKRIKDAADKGLKYYVYTLHKPDGKIFYVGKGSGDRIRSTIGRSKENPYKFNIIKKYGYVPNIYCFFEKESDAFLQEIDLIECIGLDNLTNLTRGGEGVAGIISPKRKPVRVGEIVYSTASDAAKGCGVGRTKIYAWLRKGEVGQNHRKILINGKSYRGLQEASLKSRIPKRTLLRMLKDGRAEYISEEVTYRY